MPSLQRSAKNSNICQSSYTVSQKNAPALKRYGSKSKR